MPRWAADMVAIQEAAVRAAGLVHDGISPGAWVELMAQFNAVLGGRDPVVRRAVALAPLVGDGPGAGRAPFEVEPAGTRDEVTPGEHRLLRLATLQATRAAMNPASLGERLLLSGVERELLEGQPRRGPVEAALRGWGSAVSEAAGGMSPETALTVAWTQRALLRQGLLLLGRHELVDGVGHARLLDAVEASSATWGRAHATWREMVPRQPAPMDALRRATVALQLAIRDAPEQEVLEQLVRTGFGGNLVAALAVTPRQFRESSELVAAAMDLEPKSDVATSFRPLAPTQSVAPAITADRPAPAVSLSEPAGPQPEPRTSSVIDMEQVVLSDRTGLEELARVRDAGVMAGAARSGVPEARRAVGDATDDELRSLVELGDHARTAIAEAGLPMVRHWAKRVFPPGRNEFVQGAVVPLMDAAARWDPQKASWATYAYATVRFAFFHEISRQAARREFPSETLGEQRLRDSHSEQVFGSVATLPEDVVVGAMERQRARQFLALVPPPLRDAVVARMGRPGEGTPPMAAVADRLGLAPTTASRRVGKGIEQLKRLVEDGEATGPASLRHLAMALRSEPKHAEGPAREAPRAAGGGTSVTPSCV